MTIKILITPLAAIDIDDIVLYLTSSNPDVALHFFDDVRSTFADIARNPGIGVFYESPNSRLQDMRRWPVKNFDKYLIFYKNAGDQVEIIRVLHGKRDLEIALNQF
jgi:toxin ParE1/3/4